MSLLDESKETMMDDNASLIISLPPGRFLNVAKASRDRDQHADKSLDTVIFRDDRDCSHYSSYDWCYFDVWRNAVGFGRRGCTMIVLRHGKRRSGKTAY